MQIDEIATSWDQVVSLGENSVCIRWHRPPNLGTLKSLEIQEIKEISGIRENQRHGSTLRSSKVFFMGRTRFAIGGSAAKPRTPEIHGTR